ncbi:arylsulfatase [Rhizobium ruizarguesonis]|uniref:Arylsulfatase n=2 Tax=Rhizobium ruizarguesonis TaxID=2081791 RepID=A0AB38IBR5_9HYPH|nr:arylsulfatase [Rhizobium ruizarguesonis]
MLAGAALLALGCGPALAQQVAGTTGSPGATTTIEGKQLPPPDPKFGGVIKEKASESTPWWAPRVVPPKSAPNVLLIMTDDQGFGAPSTFGGVIPTPAMDRIANHGLRFTNFHSTSLCSPTRAALITGRNHHSVGFGVVGEIATGFPGYDSIIPIEKGTVGTILKENGYATSWFGKDHNTPSYQSSQAGPFNQWPTGMGFDYFYGFVGGDASQWQPNLFRNTTAIYPFEGKPGWNMETAMADEAIQHIKQLKEIAPGKPWLVYYVPGATHAPHHPTPEWIKKISDMHLFDDGWNKLRETIFANQKRLGIMPENAQLTPWPKGLPEWESLGLEEKKLFIKQADVYGAYLAYADNEIGRIIQAVEDLGELDNTLIIYIGGDNGASAEGMVNGTPNEFTTFNGVPVPVKDQFLWYPFWGSERTFPHFAAGWAWAMDTPFKWVKQVPSHFGGTAQGVAMSWPGHITDVGGIRNQFHHVIDIVPTILEATGIPAPDTINGIAQRPIEGVSMMYTWDKANAKAPSQHTTQYFEMLGNRAIYQDGWVAATTPVTLPWELSSKTPPDVITGYNWELYNVEDDPTQNNDLAAKMPDKLKKMEDLFYSEAKKYNVLPLDNSTLARWNTPRPSLTAGQTEFTYSGELSGVPASAAPSILNKSYTITAEVEIPEGGAEGMIVTEGGRFGGYGLFLSKGEFGFDRGKVVFLYNLLDLKRTLWEGSELQPGKHTIVFDFKSDGPELGKGGTGVLSVDGKEVARNSIDHGTPITFPEDETFDVGLDTRTPLALLEYRYDTPFRFTGKINKLTFSLQ